MNEAVYQCDLGGRIPVDVTQADIDTGIPLDADSCAVAKALFAKYGGTWQATLYYNIYHWPGDGRMYAYALSWRGRKFMRDFDAGRAKPGRVWLRRCS